MNKEKKASILQRSFKNRQLRFLHYISNLYFPRIFALPSPL
jgi:hypothetical protein